MADIKEMYKQKIKLWSDKKMIMVLVPNLIVPMPTWHYLITSRPPSKSRYLFSDKIVMACFPVLTSWWIIWWCSIMFEKRWTRIGQMMRIVDGNIDKFGMGDGFGMFWMVMIMTVMVMIHSYDKKRNDEQGEFNVSKRFYWRSIKFQGSILSLNTKVWIGPDSDDGDSAGSDLKDPYGWCLC